MENKKEIKIIIIYLGVANIRSEDIETYSKKITERIIPTTIEAEFILIPTQSVDTRIECINPKYITNEELKKQHTLQMQYLQEVLENQINEIKNEKD